MIKLCGIYCIKNTVNDKVYVGQSKNIKARFYIHKSNLIRNNHSNPHLQKAWNREGESSFSFSILEECKESELDDKEKKYIEKYNSYKNGYNLTTGGKGDYEIVYRTEEEKKKHGDKQRKGILNSINDRKSKTGKCVVCGKDTENMFVKYCENHSGKCPKCGGRSKGRTLCQNCKRPRKYNPNKEKQGKTLFCKICGKEVERTGKSQYYCQECSYEKRKERYKRYKANKKERGE